MIQSLYLGRVGYDEALRLQDELVDLRYQGRVGNVLLLLEHPPVLTLGRNAHRENIIVSDEMLAQRGITIHEIKRGGDVTYHGPGQLVGYPIFDLRSLSLRSLCDTAVCQPGLRMGPVDFVRQLEEILIRLCGVYGVPAARIPGLTGAWCGVNNPLSGDLADKLCDTRIGDRPMRTKFARTGTVAMKDERKIAAIGIHVSRGITSHGFAFNATTDLGDFALINPCGITDRAVTSLARESRGLMPSLQVLAERAAQLFGDVFGERVEGVASVEALMATAHAPAEDTPLTIPADLRRLSGDPAPPTCA